MASLPTLVRRLRLLLGRRAFERDLDDELRFHVDMQAARNVERGMPPAAARALAEREFGMVARHKEEVRDARGLTWADDLGRDVRFGLRGLRRSPAFVTVAVLCLALGIGANAAIFSVVNAVLLKPLPYGDPDRLVQLNETFTWNGVEGTGSISYPDFVDWQAQATAFERIGGYVWGNVNLQGTEQPERLLSVAATADVFPVLGVRPALGRTFAPGEDRPGRDQVVVLSDALWRKRFGADPRIVGRAIALDGKPRTVVGVMPPAFSFPPRWRTDVWVPLAADSNQVHGRGRHFMFAVARLEPGVTLDRANAQLKAVAARIAAANPDDQAGRSALVTPLRETVVGWVRPALLVLLGAVGLVLLIACANVANLLLVRAAVRRHEVAIRLALGASRARLVRQFLVESLLLAAAGAAAGGALAWAALHALRPFTESAVRLAGAVPLDRSVFLFLVAITLLSGLAFGLVPALQASGGSVRSDLMAAGTKTTATAGQQRFRSALVVGEIALSLVLLVGAGLLMRGFLLLRGVAPGFDAEGVLTAHVAIPAQRLESLGPTQPFLRPALERLRQIPGVRSVGLINMLPTQNYGSNGTFGVVGQDPLPPERAPIAEVRAVSPGYFQSLGIPLKAGRLLAEYEGARGEQSLVINETLARQYLKGDPVGQQLTGFAETPYTVVGVVGDVRQSGLTEAPRAEAYFSYADTAVTGFFDDVTFVIKTSGEPSALEGPVRAALHAVAPDIPVFGVRTMEEVVSASLSWNRYTSLLLGAFAGVALLLSVVGLYGVISYLVTQRTREMGIRMALGAQARDVVRLVMRHGARLTVAGVVLGLAGAYAFTRLLASLLYGVSARDPLTFALVPAVLAAVALAAAYVPARRASRADPLLAIRAE
jgi:putative ABC transport system permease protein